MTEEKLKHLLGELREQLDKTEGVDADVYESLDQLETDIDDLVDPETDSDDNSVLDDAMALEARFEAEHPLAARILQEVINTLNRIGI